MGRPEFDRIGYWSQIKLDILREYAVAYSKILASQPGLSPVYVDAFAGAGIHELKATGELLPGSPLNALSVDPPFAEIYLIDLDGVKVAHLQKLIGYRRNVFIYEGDCNRVLIDRVLPRIQYEDFRRGLCLLDPYGLTLNWEVIEKIGKMKSIDMFLNFPIMDINRNALWTNPAGVASEDVHRMTQFWGDDSWRSVVYASQGKIFGGDDLIKKANNRQIVNAFRNRLREVAGFSQVPEPIPMRNSKNADVYYLFFASQKRAGAKIARHIFKKYGVA